jgi:AcrR family transcriptional regulator
MVQTAQQPSTHEAILKACERVLARAGYSRLTMDDVAQEARLTRRSVYLHFPNKQALVSQTIDAIVERTRQAMREAFNAGKTGLDGLRRMLVARIQVRCVEVSPMHHTLDEVYRDLYPHDTEGFVSYFTPEAELLAEAIRAGQKDGSVRRIDPDVAGDMLVRATNGLLPSNLTREEMRDLSSALSKLDLLVDVLVAGLAAEVSP